MTDPLLAAVVATSFVSCALAAKYTGTNRGRLAGYALFASFGAGLLCKGPVALVMFGIGALPWVALYREWKAVRNLPWLGGISLTLLIAAPWYIAAEGANPGFLEYFLVNENLLRYFVRNYGDRYGSSHVHPYGTVWLMFLGALFPWSCALLALPFSGKLRSGFARLKSDKWSALALAWTLAPCLLFTPSKQVSFAYVFPTLAGASILLAHTTLRLAKTNACVPGFIVRQGHKAVLVVMTGIFLVSGILWWETVPLLLCCMLIVLLVVLARQVSFIVVEDTPLPRVAIRSAFVFSLYMVVTLALNHPIESALSSKKLVQSNLFTDEASVKFLDKIPQSAYFYARLGGHSLGMLKMLRSEDLTGENDPLMMTRKQFKRLHSKQPGQWCAEKEFGAWVRAVRCHRADVVASTGHL